MIDPILLGLLMYGDMSGYMIKQAIQSGPSHFYDASFGSIYPSLKRLEQKKLVTCKEVLEGKRLKKVYTLQPEGETMFMTWLRSPMDAPNNAANFLTRIFFFEFLEKTEVEDLLKSYIDQIKFLKKGLMDMDTHVYKHSSRYQYGTLQYGQAYYVFLENWLSELLEASKNFTEADYNPYRWAKANKGGQNENSCIKR